MVYFCLLVQSYNDVNLIGIVWRSINFSLVRLIKAYFISFVLIWSFSLLVFSLNSLNFLRRWFSFFMNSFSRDILVASLIDKKISLLVTNIFYFLSWCIHSLLCVELWNNKWLLLVLFHDWLSCIWIVFLT